jgi:hypothetical protein
MSPPFASARADVLAGVIAIEEMMILGGYLTLIVCTRGVRDGWLINQRPKATGISPHTWG